MFNMDEEHESLMLIVFIIFLIILFTIVVYGYNMKGDYKAVNTLISKSLS
jgi:hypothetical protein